MMMMFVLRIRSDDDMGWRILLLSGTTKMMISNAGAANGINHRERKGTEALP